MPAAGGTLNALQQAEYLLPCIFTLIVNRALKIVKTNFKIDVSKSKVIPTCGKCEG